MAYSSWCACYSLPGGSRVRPGSYQSTNYIILGRGTGCYTPVRYMAPSCCYHDLERGTCTFSFKNHPRPFIFLYLTQINLKIDLIPRKYHMCCSNFIEGQQTDVVVYGGNKRRKSKFERNVMTDMVIFRFGMYC